MPDPKIATSAEQPINRHAGLSSYQGKEGELVGLDSTGNVVKADGASAVAQPALGVLLSPVDDPANYPTEAVALTVEANRTVAGRDRVTVVKYGVEIENNAEDWAFTPGGRVYLGSGGGFTQTEPVGASGDLRQVVGVALTPERIMLDVNPDYTVA